MTEAQMKYTDADRVKKLARMLDTLTAKEEMPTLISLGIVMLHAWTMEVIELSSDEDVETNREKILQLVDKLRGQIAEYAKGDGLKEIEGRMLDHLPTAKIGEC